jgi:hypothetical protein
MCLIVASVTMLLITLLDDNEAKPPIIVAYLRKPHICNNILPITLTLKVLFLPHVLQAQPIVSSLINHLKAKTHVNNTYNHVTLHVL